MLRTVATIASAIGIKQVKSNLLPEEKITVFKDYLAVLFSFTGILTPLTGALFHNFESVLVVIDAALLLRAKA